MDRDAALRLLREYVKNPKMISHCLASEMIMRKLAKHFGENEENWGIAGLLHDIDVEITDGNPKTHGQVCIPILKEAGISDEIIDAISMHNEESAPKSRNTKFQHALAAGETLSGMIFATALVYPDKKISSVKVSSVIKRMKDKRFAASVKRENILECQHININLDKFVGMCLEALTEKENDLSF
ncbi:MAG TPA: HDIG domain-containing protein [Bacteroidales bacterium]|nr:HDIG domain-containing protein [Bacteroidales bacterium]